MKALVLFAGVCVWGAAWAQPGTSAVAPPSEVRAFDTPSDSGSSITVTWRHGADAPPGAVYRVEVAPDPEGPFQTAAEASPAGSRPPADSPSVQVRAWTPPGKEVSEALQNGHPYYFRVAVQQQDTTLATSAVVEARAAANWFSWTKLNNLVLTVAFCGLIFGAIHLARRRDLYIRRIAGLEALDEALGRATEMGRAVLFVHGLRGMEQISTIASVSILGRVAQRTAAYGTQLRVANSDPVVMSVSQETVKESYVEAGRPDAYDPDCVFIAGTDQFSYAAAVQGIMVRERPAATIMMGFFYAEALLLSETGAMTGAIQIAGTDAFTQLPFFVTTCDYTLLGEELYAASAYLSREPRLLGSLKGQDVGKAILIAVLLLGTLLATVGLPQLTRLFHAS